MRLRLRPARKADGPSLFPIVCEFATSFTPERRAFAATLRKLLGDTHARLLVAELGGNIIGYLLGFDHPTFYANGPVAWVEEVAVQSAFRGKGIGRALMQRFEEWASARGAKVVALATRRAGKFYLALGYEESATYFRKVI